MNGADETILRREVSELADDLHAPHYERALTPEAVLDFLHDHVGKANGLTAREIVVAMCGFGTALGERRLRKVIVALRAHGHPIGADPRHGYFVAENAEELDASCEFLYERAMTSLQQICAMRKVSLPELRGQLDLPIFTTTPEKAA